MTRCFLLLLLLEVAFFKFDLKMLLCYSDPLLIRKYYKKAFHMFFIIIIEGLKTYPGFFIILILKTTFKKG